MFCVKANPQLNKESFNFNVHGKYPYFTRTTNNNGILGYVDYLDEEHKIQGETIAVGMLGMRFFYMDSDFYAGQFTKTLFPTYSFLNKNNVQYFIALLNKQSGLYKSVLVRDFEKVFYDSKLLLPVKGGKIDFDFIESYMRELEQERIRELEQYLRVTGLDTYALTPREHEILTSHASGATRLFKVSEILSVATTKKKFNAVDVTFGGKHPYVVRTSQNNGIRGYVSEDEKYLNPACTISFGQDTATMFFQEKPYFTGDKIKIMSLKYGKLTEQIACYIIAAMGKTFHNFKWGESSFNEDVLNDVELILPVTPENELDFEYMETYICAIEKVVIRGVVEWKNKVIEATKSVVNA